MVKNFAVCLAGNIMAYPFNEWVVEKFWNTAWRIACWLI